MRWYVYPEVLAASICLSCGTIKSDSVARDIGFVQFERLAPGALKVGGKKHCNYLGHFGSYFDSAKRELISDGVIKMSHVSLFTVDEVVIPPFTSVTCYVISNERQ